MTMAEQVQQRPMNYDRAVVLLCREIDPQALTDEARAALGWLTGIDIDEVAYHVINHCDEIIDEWGKTKDDDDTLFTDEEEAYITAHKLLGLEVQWPEGYVPWNERKDEQVLDCNEDDEE